MLKGGNVRGVRWRLGSRGDEVSAPSCGLYCTGKIEIGDGGFDD